MSASEDSLVRAIEALLPQTQCGRCGYPNCHDYAAAIARGEAGINRCAPGGQAGVDALAALLDRATQPLDPAFGVEAPPVVALIDEDVCIGCTKCIQACPVDAIVGAAKHMHTVIADECTGCGLCVEPCPVDCITLVPSAAQPLARGEVMARAAHARERYEARNERLEAARNAPRPTLRAAREQPEPAQEAPAAASANGAARPAEEAPAAPISHAAVLEAIARGRARRAATSIRGGK